MHELCKNQVSWITRIIQEAKSIPKDNPNNELIENLICAIDIEFDRGYDLGIAKGWDNGRLSITNPELFHRREYDDEKN